MYRVTRDAVDTDFRFCKGDSFSGPRRTASLTPRQARPILGTKELAAPPSNCAVFGRSAGEMGEWGAVACGARGKEYDQPVSSAWSNPGELWQEHRAVTHADIESRVVKIVAQQLGVDKDLVTSDASFEGDLGAGEFDMAEMISLFETEFRSRSLTTRLAA